MSSEMLEASESVSVILIEPEKPGNLGSISRAIKNFGFKKLILINPWTEINQESINYAVHGVDILNQARIKWYPVDKSDSSLSDFFQDLFSSFDIVVGTSCRIFKEKSLHRIPITIDDFTSDLRRVEDLKGKKIALVFGKESSGLPNLVLKEVDMLVTIPTSVEYASLNLSHAVTIFLHELSKVFRTTRAKGEIFLSSRDKREVLFNYFNKLIELTSPPMFRWEKISRSFKSIISRAHVSKRELSLLLGVFRVAVEKLESFPPGEEEIR
ncbi:MAG: RNA methyltransferase [Promethearchaeota archaeon]